MNFVKNDLWIKMEDSFFTYSLLIFIKGDCDRKLDIKFMIDEFAKLKTFVIRSKMILNNKSKIFLEFSIKLNRDIELKAQ